MRDRNVPWGEPLEVRIGRKTRTVGSVDEAAELFRFRWPAHPEAYETALQACLDGLMDRVAPAEVRARFRDAAQEAGVLLES